MLELLKWLATSQAGEDLNSDDELLRETILSPLLPETTIDKVLEKANMDYDMESQKECQDILDSVKDIISFDDIEERNPHSNDPCNCSQTSLEENKIPQVDGSSDDFHLYSIESAENLSKLETKTESGRSLEHQVAYQAGPSFSGRKKKKKKIWGSLPFSVTKKLNDDLETTVNMSDTCSSESIDCQDTSSSAKNELAEHLNASKKYKDTDDCGSTTLIGCSVRDLMRKKRCFRTETNESETHGGKKLLLIGERNEQSSLVPKQLDFNSLQDDKLDKRALGSLNHKPSLPLVSSTDNHIAGYSKEPDFGQNSLVDIKSNVYTSDSASPLDVQLPIGVEGPDSDKYGSRRVSTVKEHTTTEEIPLHETVINDTNVLQNDTFIGAKQGQDSGVCDFGCPASSSLSDVKGKELDMAGLTVFRKNPTFVYQDGWFENASSSGIISQQPFRVSMGKHERISGHIVFFHLSKALSIEYWDGHII